MVKGSIIIADVSIDFGARNGVVPVESRKRGNAAYNEGTEIRAEIAIGGEGKMVVS